VFYLKDKTVRVFERDVNGHETEIGQYSRNVLAKNNRIIRYGRNELAKGNANLLD